MAGLSLLSFGSRYPESLAQDTEIKNVPEY